VAREECRALGHGDCGAALGYRGHCVARACRGHGQCAATLKALDPCVQVIAEVRSECICGVCSGVGGWPRLHQTIRAATAAARHIAVAEGGHTADGVEAVFRLDRVLAVAERHFLEQVVERGFVELAVEGGLQSGDLGNREGRDVGGGKRGAGCHTSVGVNRHLRVGAGGHAALGK